MCNLNRISLSLTSIQLSEPLSVSIQSHKNVVFFCEYGCRNCSLLSYGWLSNLLSMKIKSMRRVYASYDQWFIYIIVENWNFNLRMMLSPSEIGDVWNTTTLKFWLVIWLSIFLVKDVGFLVTHKYVHIYSDIQLLACKVLLHNN